MTIVVLIDGLETVSRNGDRGNESIFTQHSGVCTLSHI
jgi:hypothetical protein